MKGFIYKFVMAIGLIMESVTASATVTYVYTDPQGTPLAEADASGAITATFDYKPYGSQALGSPKAGLGYTGHVNDPDTGFVYMQARYYDPGVGRFFSTDPMTPAAGNGFNFNRYAYANNNAVNNADPTGEACEPSGNATGCETTPPPPPSPSPPDSKAAPLLPVVTVRATTSNVLPRIGSSAVRAAGLVALGAELFFMDANGFHDMIYGHQCCYGELPITATSKPPADAKDPDGAKAPGKPGEAEGFQDPKTGERWAPNPNGRGAGWVDAGGKVWVPTGHGGSAHGGKHWDVQDPTTGRHVNVYPGGLKR